MVKFVKSMWILKKNINQHLEILLYILNRYAKQLLVKGLVNKLELGCGTWIWILKKLMDMHKLNQEAEGTKSGLAYDIGLRAHGI